MKQVVGAVFAVGRSVLIDCDDIALLLSQLGLPPCNTNEESTVNHRHGGGCRTSRVTDMAARSLSRSLAPTQVHVWARNQLLDSRNSRPAGPLHAQPQRAAQPALTGHRAGVHVRYVRHSAT